MAGDWEQVDRYLDGLFAPADEALEAALAASAAAGLPSIQVSATQGKLLQLLVRAVQAQRVLEIGTLGGYSTIWMARGLPPEGRLVTLEVDEAHAAVARANVAHAGVGAQVDVRLGPALETLPGLAGGGPPFDFVFIDADKPNIPEYFDWAVRLSRPGALIVVDNVVRDGAVADAASADRAVQGVRRFNAAAAADPRVSVTTIQTVGGKGYDGFAMALVVDGKSSTSNRTPS
jgi:predicted O-methyltransferase YrrM